MSKGTSNPLPCGKLGDNVTFFFKSLFKYDLMAEYYVCLSVVLAEF